MTERTQLRILLDPELALGEAYMDGTFVVEYGSIADALAILLGPARNGATLGQAAMVAALFQPARHAVQLARPGENNVAHHYDLDGGCIPSSSTPTSNIAAPISKRRIRRSMMPSLPRSAILPPSS